MGIAVPTIEGAGVNLHRDIGFLGPFELVLSLRGIDRKRFFP